MDQKVGQIHGRGGGEEEVDGRGGGGALRWRRRSSCPLPRLMNFQDCRSAWRCMLAGRGRGEGGGRGAEGERREEEGEETVDQGRGGRTVFSVQLHVSMMGVLHGPVVRELSFE